MNLHNEWHCMKSEKSGSNQDKVGRAKISIESFSNPAIDMDLHLHLFDNWTIKCSWCCSEKTSYWRQIRIYVLVLYIRVTSIIYCIASIELLAIVTERYQAIRVANRWMLNPFLANAWAGLAARNIRSSCTWKLDNVSQGFAFTIKWISSISYLRIKTMQSTYRSGMWANWISGWFHCEKKL